MKAFKGGMLGCFGVGAAILIVIIAIAVIASTGKNGGTTSGTPAPVGTKVLLDMSGSGIKDSQNFNAPNDWTIDYTYDCTKFGQAGNFAIMVDGSTTAVAANTIGKSGSDTANLHSGGQVHVSVNSECDWHIVAKG